MGMMSYTLYYHPRVKKEDLAELPRTIKERIRQAIEQKLLSEPDRYGQPLKKGLQGYRKLRIGDYRVIYKVNEGNIFIFKIGHRKDVYKKVKKRI